MRSNEPGGPLQNDASTEDGALDGSPFVSVVVPVRNEGPFIAELIEALSGQDYPLERFEIIVADGMSTDGTRETLAALQTTHPNVSVIDNPDRIVPTALNLAVARSRGDVIIRIDGHACVTSDFIRQNVLLMGEHPEAWSVGGPIRHAGRTTFGRAVALAMSHPLGVGNASHRYPHYEGYVEGAQFPAIRRWVFDRIGPFDERLVRNQDDEFNYRLNRAGGRVYVSPRVRYSYYVRSRPRQLFRQYFQYGFWRIPVIEKHRQPTTWRQMVPTTFYAVCGLLLVSGLWRRDVILAAALPVTYLSVLLSVGAAKVREHGLNVSACVPAAIGIMHAGYAWGLAYGLWARVFRPHAWDTHGRMSTISR